MEQIPTIHHERRRPADVPFRFPSWAWPILIAGLMGIGGAKVMLASKEDQAAHDADIAEVRADHTSDVNRLQSQHDLDSVRDSARHADVMRILLDVQRKVNR